jgi:hypothetical protein
MERHALILCNIEQPFAHPAQKPTLGSFRSESFKQTAGMTGGYPDDLRQVSKTLSLRYPSYLEPAANRYRSSVNVNRRADASDETRRKQQQRTADCVIVTSATLSLNLPPLALAKRTIDRLPARPLLPPPTYGGVDAPSAR